MWDCPLHWTGSPSTAYCCRRAELVDMIELAERPWLTLTGDDVCSWFTGEEDESRGRKPMTDTPEVARLEKFIDILDTISIELLEGGDVPASFSGIAKEWSLELLEKVRNIRGDVVLELAEERAEASAERSSERRSYAPLRVWPRPGWTGTLRPPSKDV